LAESSGNRKHPRDAVMGVTSRLFVYGTLRRDCRHGRPGLLGSKAEFVALARMRGRLADLGRYPGLVSACGSDDWVRGEVYALQDPVRTLARLDAYEGSAFRRICAEAVQDCGRKIRTWVYVYEGAVPRGRMIPSGDYLDPDGAA
jgi:gamma-glutamylcyclotransferase (GGCT)/AIG2-like uncharacterized protein YtfP